MPASSPLELGRSARGKAVALSDRERSTHMQVIGATDTGKSRLLEHMVRQDIARGRGLCLIDPHGTLSDRVERWCASRGIAGIRKVHLVKPGADGWTAGFNPVRVVEGQATEVRVDAMVTACSQVWGGQDLNQTPRLKKVLRAVFYALAARNLTLAEALHFLQSGDPDGTRAALTAALDQPVFDFVWSELNGLNRREFAEYTESTISRLVEFLASPAIRLMVGQQAAALDFRRIMDAGEIVIVNLGSRAAFSRADAGVLGTLIINDLFLTALARDPAVAERRPFTLYLDEAHRFLTSDVAEILDQTRKFGLHAVLAHQRLNQLRTCGADVYDAVMGSTRTKVVFALESDEDAGEMARQVLRSTVNLERTKRILDKPIVVDEVVRRFSAGGSSETTGDARTVTETGTWGLARGTSAQSGEVYSVASDGSQQLSSISALLAEIDTITERVSYGVADTHSQSRTESASWREGLVAVRKTLPTATYSLEEQLHLAQLKLRQLKPRHAIIKRRDHPPTAFRVAEVRDPIESPALLQRFEDKVNDASPYVRSTAEAQMEIEARHASLLPRRAEETEFWSE